MQTITTDAREFAAAHSGWIPSDCGGAAAETNCTIAFEGREFESGGALVSPEFASCYLPCNAPCGIGYRGGDFTRRQGDSGKVQDWHGREIGSYVITGRWDTPRSWISSYQVSARVNIAGRVYNMRGCGAGMILSGRAKKQQPASQG